MPDAGKSSPAIYETRQHVEDFVIAQAPLAGGASATSDTRLVKGYSSIRILARSNVAGTVEVYQAVTNPAGGTTFVLTQSKAAALVGAEFVAFFDSVVFGNFARIVYVNGAGVQTVFAISAYAIPISGGSGGGGGATVQAEACTKVFCYLTFA